ncbi:protein kinase [Streptomyces platensis]|uniref:serine/threonine-protein kinase n=1 Tax=Streptomyces platensis TaxID=58346 RepID=UPI0030E287B5
MKQLEAADPRQIGPYTLLGRLGAGGMGAVYLGRARGRTVAVKVVRPDLARDDAFRDRFQREVEAARLVSGAFTAPVVDADTRDRIPWMATAFVVGVSLDQAVSTRGPLPEDALWALTAGVAEALASVHDARLIHRDLKPANVLLALDGPRVIDFGIARAVDGTALTSTGAIIGSAPYMSPEQAVGEALTSASDMFSLGSAIAFAAGGDSLFGAGAAAGVLFRIVHTEPDLGAVPAGLRDLIASCLAKSPDDRPTPRQVSEFVEREGHPIPSGGWLPEAVAADIIAVRAVMTTLPEPPPTRPFTQVAPVLGSAVAVSGAAEPLPAASDGAGPGRPESGRPEPGDAVAGHPEPDRPGPDRPWTSRRKLILGLAGGTLAVAGAGTWLALGGTGQAGGGSGRPRPSGDLAKLRSELSKLSSDPSKGTGLFATKSFIWAVDPAAGKLRWETTFKNTTMGQVSLKVPSSGTHLLWTTSNPDRSAPKLAGLDVHARGKIQWQQPAPGGGQTSGHESDFFTVSWHDGPHCSAGGNFLYLGDRLYAVDATNGQKAWQSPDRVTIHAMAASPDGSTVYAAGPDFQGHVILHAFDAQTGAIQWAGSLPMLNTGILALQSTTDTTYLWARSQLWALDPETGKARWSYEFAGSTTSWTSPVAFWADNDHAYGPTEKGLTAIAAGGK